MFIAAAAAATGAVCVDCVLGPEGGREPVVVVGEVGVGVELDVE